MNILSFIILCVVSSAYMCAQNTGTENDSRLLDMVSAELSFNATADEGVLGAGLSLSRWVYEWPNGKFYGGVGLYHGISLVTYENPRLSYSSTLWQYIQLQGGHQFELFGGALFVRSGLSIGPSTLRQKAALEDARYDINSEYSFSKTYLTVHAQTGIGSQFSSTLGLELFVNLPIITPHIAPLGIGLGVRYVL